MNDADYEQAVATYYDALYAFGYSLAGNEDDACELTQETYCRLLDWNGHKVSLICFELENKQVAHLLVVDSAAFNDAPTESPVFKQVGDLATASWSRGGKTYIVASKGGSQFELMKLL